MAKKSKSKAKMPKGRAGQKKKVQRGAPTEIDQLLRGSRWPGALVTDDDDDGDGDSTFRGFKGFAQPRSRDERPRDPAFRLRHQTISFVSAGTNTPIETLLPQPSDASLFITREAMETNGNSSNIGDPFHEPEKVSVDALKTNIMMDADVELPNNALANMNLDGAADDAPSQVRARDSTINAVVDQSNDQADTPLFVIDTVGDTSLVGASRNKSNSHKPRTASLAQSDSSEEVVVFHGRKKPTIIDDPVSGDISNKIRLPSHPRTAISSAKDATPHANLQANTAQALTATTRSEGEPSQAPEDLLTALEAVLAPPQQSSSTTSFPPAEDPRFKASGWCAKQSIYDRTVDLDATWAPAPSGKWWRQKKPPPQETAEETIAQLQADWKRTLREKKQGKKSSPETDLIKLKSPKPQRRGKRGGRKDRDEQLETFTSDDVPDNTSEAAFEDYMENLAAQLEEDNNNSDDMPAFAAFNSAHNAALGGPSMMVDGREISENELLDEHMNIDEEDEDDGDGNDGLSDQDWSDASSEELDDELNLSNLGSTDLEEVLEYTEQEQWEDEEDLRQRRVDAMSDEKIARLFAKQQELGFHGDELILEDGEHFETDDTDGVGDLEAAREALANLTRPELGQDFSKTPRRARGARGGPNFVNASMLADMVDQYSEKGFDIMDFDRPSLRPAKKGRKGQLPPELEALSDEELRDTMADAWANDRSKKAKKKAEREELRHQGLLASKDGKPDLVEKYQNGITMAQVQLELRAFLLDNSTTRAFPPMDKNDRKDLHMIANSLKLKSKSVGAGKMRRPVLYKTTKTLFSLQALDNVISRSERGWLGSSRKGQKNAFTARGGGGGFSKAAVSLRNGEVVGAGAAEIGKENFGHRMMEKMGWSKGQALGKDGEGRLAPVEQIMRAGRAGLG